MDAGTLLTLNGPLGSRTLTKTNTGEYQVNLGSGFNDLRLPFGEYTLTGFGGRDLGGFKTTIVAGANFEWTNRYEIGPVDRRRPLQIYWTGKDLKGYVMFGGGSSVTGVGRAFVCVEEAAKRTLIVPEFILRGMPSSPLERGYLFLAPHPLQNAFSAPGLTRGFFVDFSSDSKEVEFQ